MTAADVLLSVVADNRRGRRRALPSWCTAHPETLAAILSAYANDDAPVLIEATCNQVNQDGGYTGMTPADFRRFVEQLAVAANVDPGRIVLGGDHLGPNPWRHLTAREAMRKAGDLVKAYVEAGYVKIHLDASMRCADDSALSEPDIAERAADLCAIAEAASGGSCVYVVGTEVPIPGGETTPLSAHSVTPAANVSRTLDLHAKAFAARGVADAMQRVAAIVVQPGVDFNNESVVEFDKAAAAPLAQALAEHPSIAFEAHSTDFQSDAALADLVALGCAVLKVGPELTFAFREAAFALAAIERPFSGLGDSEIVRALEAAMEAEPADWRPYVVAGPNERIDRLFGLSDRVRYYWGKPGVRAALQALVQRVGAAPVRAGVLRQFCGEGGSADIAGRRVGAVVSRYRIAAGESLSG